MNCFNSEKTVNSCVTAEENLRLNNKVAVVSNPDGHLLLEQGAWENNPRGKTNKRGSKDFRKAKSSFRNWR